MAKVHTSKIELNVELDENRIPEKLNWTAEDGGVSNAEAKAIFLSVWDAKAQESLRIDLWTKDMPVDEMKLFFHQTLTEEQYIQMNNIRKKVTKKTLRKLYNKDCSNYPLLLF